MENASNPFHYGSPAQADSFADRDEELQDIASRMLNGQNVILLSPRRFGKTSLLLEAIQRVRAKRGRSGYVSLLLCTTHQEVAEAILSGVLNGPLSWLTGHAQRLGQVLSRVRFHPAIEVDALGMMKASLASVKAEQVDWQQVISTSLRLLREASEGNHPVSLVLDEFQQVAEVDESLPALFKVMADELRQVSLVFSGSNMHVMERIAIGPSAPLMGMGERMSLGPVPEDAMAAFLSRRARSAGKRLSVAVARDIYRAADGVPNDVQRLAFEAFELAGEDIDRAVVDQALRRVVSHWVLNYEEEFLRLAPGQQRVLKALARDSELATSSISFIRAAGLANASSVRRALDALENQEMVVRRAGGWAIADPFFRRWLAEGR